MTEDPYPVRWAGSQAVVELPEHVNVSNAAHIREELLSVMDRGATSLIADMTATISCDHPGAGALAEACRRIVAAGTELRLVVASQLVRHVLDISGLDRLVSIYASLDAATAAQPPAPVLALVAGIATTTADRRAPLRRAGQVNARLRMVVSPDGSGTAITPAVVWKLIDALQDGVALTDGHGSIALANTRLEEMFGYQHGELTGRSVETLIPAHLQEAHRGHRAAYSRAPAVRPMGAGAPLVGLRRDGTSFPAEISLSPVATAAGQFALTVIRDATEARRLDDLADLAGAAVAAEQTGRGQHLLDTIITGLFGAGLSLQAAMSMPPDAARQSIAVAVGHLDDVIRQIRDTVFAASGERTPVPVPTDAST
jgi:anti-anti-sigma factor